MRQDFPDNAHERNPTAVRVLFQQPEQRLVPDAPVLNDLAQPVAPEIIRQRPQRIRVYQHQFRLIECANEVLPLRQIDCDLPADRGINLRQQRRRQLHKMHAAQVRRRRQPR